jgi:hypothetical protein
MYSGDMSLWREDFERINGFDENFKGWGGEDDDLRLRLRAAGVRIRSILRWTRSYHLWHPPTVTRPERIEEGRNMAYLERQLRLTQCANGLVKRTLADLRVQLAGTPTCWDTVCRLLPAEWREVRPKSSAKPDVEILFSPGKGRFSGRADCRVLIVLEDSHRAAALRADAQVVIQRPTVAGYDAWIEHAREQLTAVLTSLMVRADALPPAAAKSRVLSLPAVPPATARAPGHAA